MHVNNVFTEAKKKAQSLINNHTETVQSEFELIEEKLALIGYKISTIEISLTIPPRFVFEIDATHTCVNEDIKNEVLKNCSTLLKTIISILDKAFSLETSFSFKTKFLSTVIVEGSLIPTLKLIYKEYA